MASISTGTPSGSTLTPTAVLACTPLSPNSSANKSEAPLATFEQAATGLATTEHTKQRATYFRLPIKTARALHHDVQLHDALDFAQLPDLLWWRLAGRE